MKKFKLLALYLLTLLCPAVNGAGKFLQNLYSSVRIPIAASNLFNNLEIFHKFSKKPNVVKNFVSLCIL
jgi:hypothetical protein